MSKGLEPMGTRVIVARKESMTKTEGGLFIPDQNQEKPCEGTITATGKKVDELKKGDIVLFGRYAGTEFTHDGETYLLMDQEDIQARVS